MTDPASGAKPRILFVEDEATIREHIARQLATDYIVDAAGDGEQALRSVLRARPDLIITDLLMPTLDGVELVKTLRATPSTATIPILMISGRAPEELRLEGFEGGADSFLPKPYTERELRARIRSMLQSAELRFAEARREAEERAEEQTNAERAALLESISDAFYAVDRQWRVTYVNQRALDYFKVSREALIGRDIFEVFPAGKGARIEEELERVQRTRAPTSFEMISPLTGCWLDVHAYPTPQGVAVNFRDITDRKRAEAALRDSEEALRKQAAEFYALADNIPTLCWMAYADGHIYWYNRRWYEYTGTTPESQEGSGWESVHDPDVLPRVKERWERSLATGEPFEMTFPLRAADGSYASFLTRVVPICDDDGAIVRWFGTNTDISPQLATERQLRELTATLEQRVEAAVAERKSAIEQLAHMQKMETIGQLTGGVAHDFNNLLTPIVGALDLLQRKLDDPRSQRLTAGALQAAERARTLIQRLLAFARKQHLQARAVEIAELMRGLLDLLTRTLGPRIEIETLIDEGLPPAQVDPNQLELAVLNLALNARDAMPDGGVLTIRARAQRIQRHATLRAGEYVQISVCDTGTGMDPATLQRAIEPFFTTKGIGQGTGLGLSMVHGLAAQSGGDLSLTSSPHHGTTATLLLPASTTAPERETAPADAQPAAGVGASRTVLIVDDEALVRISTAAMLSEAGYRPIEASSGAEALSLVQGGLDLDAMVTDYAMPGMNGAHLAQALQRLRPGVPILMITGYANLTDEDAGGIPRLAKPFSHTELAATVAELIEHSVQQTHARRAT